MRFEDRTDAGRRLARRLAHLDHGGDAVVVGLARGGVPIAAAIAEVLSLRLDIVVARRLTAPFQPAQTVGAMAERGICVTDEAALRGACLGPEELAEIERVIGQEVEQDARYLRENRSVLPLAGRTVIVADDGAVTGMTATAAIRAVRALRPYRVVLAVAVAPASVLGALDDEADEVVAIEAPTRLPALSDWYGRFAPVTDDEVFAALRRAAGEPAAPGSTAA
jgi:putative phosphoribosyl transferase